MIFISYTVKKFISTVNWVASCLNKIYFLDITTAAISSFGLIQKYSSEKFSQFDSTVGPTNSTAEFGSYRKFDARSESKNFYNKKTLPEPR